MVISNTLRSAGYYSDEDKNESNPRQIVLLPTSSGKSLCFMLPGILLDGITLMADQYRRIIESGSKVFVLKGAVKLSVVD